MATPVDAISAAAKTAATRRVRPALPARFVSVIIIDILSFDA
ncbi:hypothetical protein [Jiella sp. M17.18]